MRRRETFKPIFEVLERRDAPAVHLVTLTSDSPNGGRAGELRFEVDQAAVDGGPVVIDLGRPEGVIRLNPSLGPITASSNLTIIGMDGPIILGTNIARPNSTTQAIRFGTGVANPVSLTISGVTFWQCNAAVDPNTSNSGKGGAIFAEGNLTLNSCTFESDTAATSGGAIDVKPFNSTCTVAITGCTFMNNSASSGGALNIEANGDNDQPAAATVNVNSCTFTGNRATNGQGGAIQDTGTLQTLNVANSMFSGNTGRAIFSQTSTFLVQATPGNTCTFTGNIGGAIAYSLDGAQTPSVIVRGVTFTSNTASSGGAVSLSIDGGGTAQILGCLFNSNTASGQGGGLYVHARGTTVNIDNSTFLQNQASMGGGIRLLVALSGAEITSTTITQNVATGRGGGLFIGNTARIGNSIIAGNLAGSTGPDVFGNVASSGFNLIGISQGSNGWNTNAGNAMPDQVGTIAAPLKAGLSALANNGGPTFTMAVPSTSLAYRTGDSALFGTLDQRGRMRNGMVNSLPVVSVGAFDPDAAGGNNAPVGANGVVTAQAGAGNPNPSYTFAPANFGFSDPNNTPANNFSGVIITSLPAKGYLSVNGSRQTQIGQAIFVSAATIAAGGLVYYSPASGSGWPYTSFTFTVVSDGGTANGGSNIDPTARTMAINVLASPVLPLNPPANGAFNGSPFAATYTIAGVTRSDDTPAQSLEGVTPTLAYYDSDGNPLSSAPIGVGTYTVVASFAGSTDYASATSQATFAIAQADPSLTVSSPDGAYTGSPFAATYTIAGVTSSDDTPAQSLEGVTPTLAYYDSNGNLLSGAPTTVGAYTVIASFAGSTDYASATSQATFTITQATPTVTWNNPADIFVGTALDGTQLNAVAGTAGSFTFSPAAGTVLSAGSAQTLSVTFTPTDSVDYTTATQTVSINVATLQDATYSTIHDTPLAVPASSGLLTSVQYANAGALSISAVNGSPLASGSVTVTGSLGGTLVVNADGSFVYTPPTLTAGDDSFTFTVADGSALCTANLVIHVTETAPTVNNASYADSVVGPFWMPASSGLLTYASDPDGQPLWIAAANGTALSGGSVTVTGSGGGTLTLYTDGSFSYTPGAALADTFTFTVTDGIGSTTAQLLITNGSIVIGGGPPGPP